MVNTSSFNKTLFLIVISLFVTFTTIAQPALTADQVFKELHASFDVFKNKYQGKTIKVTGKVKHVSVSDGEVYVSITNDGFNTPVEFIFADEPQNRTLSVGRTITAAGTVNRLFAGALGKAQLKPCALVDSKIDPEKASATKPNAPKDLPMGIYNVYQGAGFAPQGSLTIYKNGSYKRYEKDMGTYSYNPLTKIIRFTSGIMEGFVGLYYTSGRNNDKNDPMIAIDFEGKIPNLNNANNGQYLYAIFDKP